METSEAPKSNVEQLLISRLRQYTAEDVSRALAKSNVNPTVGIKVEPLKPDEEVNGVLIRDSGASVLPNTRVNAHFHTGGEDPETSELEGLEVYRILKGKGKFSRGYPAKKEDGSFSATYDAPVDVEKGSLIIVKPTQVHSLFNPSDSEELLFVFTGSPKHLSNEDRFIVPNPQA